MANVKIIDLPIQQPASFDYFPLTTGVVTYRTTLASAVSTGRVDYTVVLQDQKTQNTPGGSFTSGDWRTRTLNTKVLDTGNICSLASNQFTLPPGTYDFFAVAPAYSCNRVQARLQNITDTSTTLLGGAIYAYSNVTVNNIIQGRFTIASSKTFELQQRCQSTQSTNGFGVEGNFTTEIYANVKINKIS